MSWLHRGSRGEETGRWQAFMHARGWLDGSVDGVFGAETVRATARFQASRHLEPDGIVGPNTMRAARALGFSADVAPALPRLPVPQPVPPAAPAPPAIEPPPAADPGNDFFPPKPSFRPIAGNTERQRIFGKFTFVAAPEAGSHGAIRITNDWEQRNLTSVVVPGLAGIALGSSPGTSKGRMTFHKKGANQLVGLWKAWGAAGLLDRILTFDGAFVARFQRGSATALSNHSFGSAFDINAGWNPIGKNPAAMGTRGCVFELASLANEHGFYWGGHFASRADGMHFEIAKLL